MNTPYTYMYANHDAEWYYDYSVGQYTFKAKIDWDAPSVAQLATINGVLMTPCTKPVAAPVYV